MNRGALLACALLCAACARPAAAPSPERTPTASVPPPPAAAGTRSPKPKPKPQLVQAACDDRAPPALDASAHLTSIREVDWCNHKFGMFELVNGSAQLHEYASLGGEHDTDIFRLVDVVYGDLEADGSEEAVVMIHHDFYAPDGAASNSADLFAFALRDGQPVGMGSAPASRVADWTLVIESGRVSMRYQRDQELCVERWRLLLGKLAYVDVSCAL